MSYENGKIMNLEDGQLLLSAIDEKTKNALIEKADADNVYTYKNAYGSIVTVDDAVAEAVKQIQIEIDPVQDLHGYSNPWPGGGGKNLYDFKTVYADTSKFTISEDSVTGTASNFSTAQFHIPASMVNKQCTFSAKISCGAGTTYMRARAMFADQSTVNGNTVTSGNTGISSVTFTPTSTDDVVYIPYGSGLDGVNTVSEFQLEAGSTVTTYVPYSNICSITGWAGCNVTRTGKNLLVLDSIAEIHSTAQNLRNGIEIKKPGTYTVSGKATTNVSIYARVKTSDGTYGTYTQIVNGATVNNATYTLTDGNTLIVFDATANQTVAQSKTKFENAQIQIELGSSVSSYEAPIGEVYSITFPSSAGTVYGGSLTVNKDGTGTLVVNHVKHEMPTSGFSLVYTKEHACVFSRQRNNIWDEVPVGLPNGTVKSNLLNAVQTVNSATDTPYVFSIYNSSNNYIRITLPPSVASTAEQLHTWLTNNPVEVVYDIAEPITYQLSALEVIEMLNGTNNIWADTGDILSMLYATNRSYSKEESDARYYSKEESDERYAEADASYTKEESDALYYSKEESDERYAESDASYSKDESDAKYAGIIDEFIAAPAGVVSFKDGADGIPMALTVGVEPVQDLHGYDAPWPAGGGKNLFNPNSTSIEWVNTSSQITTLSSSKSCRISVTAEEKVTLSNNVQASGSFVYLIAFIDSSDNVLSRAVATSGYSLTATAPANTVSAIVGFSNWAETGTEAQAEKNASATSYAPYENICPISGRTGCNVTRTGKNLYNIDGTDTSNGYEDGKILKSTGNAEAPGSPQYWCISEYIRVEPSTTYTISGMRNLSASGAVYCCQYDESMNFVQSVDQSFASTTLTTGSNVKFVRLTIEKSQKATVQIEKGSVASAYESFGINAYSITFPSSAGTVYGGTLTVNKDGTGTLVVDQKKVVLNGSEDWRSTTNAFYTGTTGDYLKESTAKGACDSYDFIGGISGAAGMTKNSTIGMFTGSSYHRIYIRDDQYGVDTAAFKSALATNNVTVCYELAEPQTYQLSELEVIETLKGINNIFADTGDILSVAYSADTKMYVDAGDESKQEQINLTRDMIADSDTATATESHAIGDVFICNDQLIRATDTIATGETVAIGSNAEVINLADYIKEQVMGIAVLRTDVDALKELPVSLSDILLKRLGFEDFVAESSSYGRIEFHGNVLTSSGTTAGSTFYHINLLGTHRIKSGTWGNYNPLPEDFVPIDDYFMSNLISEKNRRLCLRTSVEIQNGSGNLRIVVMKNNGDDTYTYKYTPLTMGYGNIALLDGEPLDIREWDGISLVLTSQSRPFRCRLLFAIEEGEGGHYELSTK